MRHANFSAAPHSIRWMRINRDNPLVIADRLEAVNRDAIVCSTLSLERADIRMCAGDARKSRAALIGLQVMRIVSRVDGRAGGEEGMRLRDTGAVRGQRAQFRHEVILPGGNPIVDDVIRLL